MSSTDTPLTPLIINDLTKTQYAGISQKGTNEVYFQDPQYTGGKATETDSDGNIVESSITATELGYLDGLTDNIQDQINNLKSRGRYLSQWNCVTGLASTTPATLPYEYKTGDYYNIGTVASGSGTNYRPSGSTYTGTASTTVESASVSVNDTYYYDGTQWILQINTEKTVNFSQIAGQPTDNTNLATALNGKYDASNPNNYISGITSTMVTNALGFVPYNSTNPSNYISGITSAMVTTALGYTPVQSNTAITGATHTKITYDAKGLVTAGADLTASDIPSLTLSKISDITATANEVNVLDGITATTTELNYCDGVTSNIQTQLDSKATESDLGTLAYADAITNGDISGTINQDKITNLTTDLASKLSNTTKYGASLSYSNSSLQLKDQDGNSLGSAVTIDTSKALSGLTDTTISSPTNGQALKYDSSSQKWVNGTIVTTTITYW